jgi:hypothetical protein
MKSRLCTHYFDWRSTYVFTEETREKQLDGTEQNLLRYRYVLNADKSLLFVPLHDIVAKVAMERVGPTKFVVIMIQVKKKLTICSTPNMTMLS